MDYTLNNSLQWDREIKKGQSGIMKRILRVLIGFTVGIILATIIGNMHTLSIESKLVFIIWGVGFVYAYDHHLNTLLRLLDPGLKLSIISFLTFKSGFMGTLPILLYIAYSLAFGWVYGLIVLMIDIIRIIVNHY